MPVIVVGADTPLGPAIVEALLARDGEVRAFVTDRSVGETLKGRKVKVAVGDVSDASHVGAAATRCFTAVLLTDAASDARERSFLADSSAVTAAWVDAMREAEVRRVIWVGDGAPDSIPGVEYAAIDPAGAESAAIAAEVAALDEVAAL